MISKTTSAAEVAIKVRAVDDFDPRQMSYKERAELSYFLQTRKVANKKERIVLQFKRGDMLEAIPPANIGENVGWWVASNSANGQIGVIPRNRVILEKDQETSKTTLGVLPLELLDAILESSFLFGLFNISPKQRDEDIFKALASVDFCWFQRIRRPRFKKRFWRRLKDFYGKTKKWSAIIRNNRDFLLENIQLDGELIASLLSLNCLTEVQSHFIQRQRLKRDKNAELVCVMRSFDETKFSSCIKCIRETNQRTVARVVENGGVAMKVEVKTCSLKCTTSVETQLHQTIEDLLNRTKQKSHQAERLTSELKAEGIEILNSRLDRKTAVIWIWCRSQPAIKHIQELYDSNQLADIVFGLGNIRQSTCGIVKSKMINIDSYEFKETVVVCPISVNFVERIDIGQFEAVWGVTKLRKEIYVLCRSIRSSFSTEIRVFEDRKPFHLRRKIEIKEIKYPKDIGSSETENCLYVSDNGVNCVWKITREADDQHRISRWLKMDYTPVNLSVATDGHLLMVSKPSSFLKIYESDAQFIRSMRLQRNIVEPRHAVETSVGNFIIIHESLENEMAEGRWSGERKRVTKCVVSELTSDGQLVISRFVPSNEVQTLNDPFYLSLDSDDRMIVADRENQRVVLLDSDFKWNQVLCPAKEENEETRIRWPQRLFYDEEQKQLIVGGRDFYLREAVNIYTLSRT